MPLPPANTYHSSQLIHSSSCCIAFGLGRQSHTSLLIHSLLFSRFFVVVTDFWRAWGGGDTQCAGGPLSRRYSPLLLLLSSTGVTGTVGARSIGFINSDGPPASEVKRALACVACCALASQR